MLIPYFSTSFVSLPHLLHGFKLLTYIGLLSGLSATASCKPNPSNPKKPVRNERFQKMEKLPKKLRECSGMVQLDKKHLVFINDSGNAPELLVYEIGNEVVARIKHPLLRNKDWEDLAISRSEDKIHLYISDTGNNDNDRRDLVIYEVQLRLPPVGEAYDFEPLNVVEHPFRFEDQKKFPAKNGVFYDAEALVVRDNRFYLFTRNRSKKFDGTSRVYSFAINPEPQVARFVTEVEICNDRKDCKVTGASLDNSGNRIALLTYDKVFLLTLTEKDFSSYTTQRIDLDHSSQKEAISFTDKGNLLIADERSRKEGGNLYRLDL